MGCMDCTAEAGEWGRLRNFIINAIDTAKICKHS